MIIKNVNNSVYGLRGLGSISGEPNLTQYRRRSPPLRQNHAAQAQNRRDEHRKLALRFGSNEFNERFALEYLLRKKRLHYY